MKKMWFLMFVPLLCPAQQLPLLQLQIDSIATDNSQKELRRFHLYFRISNLTEEPLSFFLNPRRIEANAVSSLSNTPFYRLYQKDEMIDVAGVFESWHREQIREVDPKIKYIERSADEYQKRRAEDISGNIQRLDPQETRHFCATLNWDKERYFTRDVYEYYLDAKDKHYIEIAVNLLREEFKPYLSERALNDVTANDCFIRGWYLSNKVEIDFSE